MISWFADAIEFARAHERPVAEAEGRGDGMSDATRSTTCRAIPSRG